MSNVLRLFAGLSVIFLLEYLLFSQYYWVVGGEALVIWGFFVVVPSLLSLCFIYSHSKYVLCFIMAIFVISSSTVIWNLLGMHETWSDMEGLVAHLKNVKAESNSFPPAIADSGYEFRQSNSMSRIKFYLPGESQAIIGFHVGDSSVAYSYSTMGDWSFDDD